MNSDDFDPVTDTDARMTDVNATAAKRSRTSAPATTKVRLVPGPQHSRFQTVRDGEAYWKDEAALHKKEKKTLGHENDKLRTSLTAAEKAAKEQAVTLQSLQQSLLEQTRTIAELQRHEGELEAQFIGDQQKFDDLHRNFAALYEQVHESQRLLMLRNEEVERLQRAVVQKTDETIQLRAYSQVQAQKTPQKKPPRRSTRASFAPVQNESNRTIEIPLNPAPVPEAPTNESDPNNGANQASAPTQGIPDLHNADYDTLAALLTKVLKLDNAEINITKTTPKKKSAKKAATPIQDREVANYIAGLLRRVTYQRFGVKQAMDFAVYTPARPDDVAACEDGIADPPFECFHWDFGAGYIKSRWNDLMMTKIVDAALEDDVQKGGLIAERGIDREVVETKLVDQLQRYRAMWKEFRPRYVEAEQRLETRAEAKTRGVTSVEQHQLNARSNGAKHRKFETRVETVVSTLEIKKLSGTASDIETWEHLLEMLQFLGEQGMSSEEEDEIEVEDTKVKVFKVKLCVWREPLVVDYLRFVDMQTSKFKEGASPRGAKPAPRLRRDEFGTAKAPRGLPESLYNSEWLKQASPGYLKELKVSKEVFGLFVAATGRMAV